VAWHVAGDGRRVLASLADGSIEVWHPDGRPRSLAARREARTTRCSFLAPANLVAAEDQNDALHLLDLASGEWTELVSARPGARDGRRFPWAVSADAKRIAFSARDGRLSVWSARGGVKQLRAGPEQAHKERCSVGWGADVVAAWNWQFAGFWRARTRAFLAGIPADWSERDGPDDILVAPDGGHAVGAAGGGAGAGGSTTLAPGRC
jgi:hypothetical protein